MSRAVGLGMIWALAGTLAGCNEPPAPRPQPSQASDSKSIFRPGFQTAAEAQKEPAAPLDLRIAFPDGKELSDDAQARLSQLVASAQVKAGGPIVLRGHSDAAGSDDANLRASQARAEVVRDFLLAQGIDGARITIIAFGEQNPIAPNALPDGTPNAAGRALNRRVEVHVDAEGPAPARQKPTLAETLSEEAAGEDGPTAMPPQ